SRRAWAPCVGAEPARIRDTPRTCSRRATRRGGAPTAVSALRRYFVRRAGWRDLNRLLIEPAAERRVLVQAADPRRLTGDETLGGSGAEGRRDHTAIHDPSGGSAAIVAGGPGRGPAPPPHDHPPRGAA